MAIAGTSSDADSGRMRNKVGEDGGGTAIWVVDRVFTVDGIAVGVHLYRHHLHRPNHHHAITGSTLE